MSKTRQKLETFREVVNRRPARAKPVEPFKWTEKLKMVIIVVFGIGAMVVVPVMDARSNQRRSIDGTLRGWKSELGLTNDEVKMLAQLEYSFHGSGNPFMSSPKRTKVEWTEHRKQLASVVRPSLEERFLVVLKKH